MIGEKKEGRKIQTVDSLLDEMECLVFLTKTGSQDHTTHLNLSHRLQGRVTALSFLMLYYTAQRSRPGNLCVISTLQCCETEK